jgi:hypothetical protein
MINYSLDIPLIAMGAGQLIALCGFTWRIAIQYAILKTQIDKNRSDLNAGLTSIRDDLKNAYQIQQMEISHIQEHLQQKDGYHPPSLRGWEKNYQ